MADTGTDVRLAIRILRSMLGEGSGPIAHTTESEPKAEQVDKQFMREVFRSIDELRESSAKSHRYLAMLEAKYGRN